jgi:hypothetical protein
MSSPIKAVGVNEVPAVEAVPYDKNDTPCCNENVELRNKIGELDKLCSSELKNSEEKNANLERQLGNYKSALQKTVQENKAKKEQENKTNIIDKTKKLGKYTQNLFTGIKKIGGSKRKTASKSKSKSKNKTHSKRKTASKSKSKSKNKTPRKSKSLPKEEPEMVFFYDMNELKDLISKHKVGTLLEYNTENQMGTFIYKIVKKSGKKTAEIIGDYYGLYNTIPSPI